MNQRTIQILDEWRRRGHVILMEHVLDVDGARYQIKEISLRQFRSEKTARQEFNELTGTDTGKRRKP